MLGITVEKVADLITRVRAFDARVELPEPAPGSDLTSDFMIEIEAKEDYEADPVYNELLDFIGGLNEEEQVNLVALNWCGRGDFTAAEWGDAVAAAREARTDHTGTYLLGIPLLGSFLEDGLEKLGYSTGE